MAIESPNGGYAERGRRLPAALGGGLLAPESLRLTLFIRVIGLLAIAATAAYLSWRVLYTINLDAAWIAIPFFLLEVYAGFSLVLFAFSTWDIQSLRPARPVQTTTARVAVLIPTYNEEEAVLLPTIAAAMALKPEHETWVLDDGDRPEVRRLAERLGARYLTRPDRQHAKAGNINHALSIIDADLVAVLDADHVSRPDFLINTLGYFEDAEVAVVQTPQDFYNLNSFEHEGTSTDGNEVSQPYHEETLFYRILQPGKNRWGAAFWCGTNAVLRVEALRSIGGVATGTVTEDIHTTVRLHRRGWKTVYHNEVLARGLAARNAAEYQAQRYRWGVGAMQLLKQENPLFVPGLRLLQRVAYASTLLGWFENWRSLGYLLIPIAVLFTGANPVVADLRLFAPIFVATFLLQQGALRVMSRGHHRTVLAIVFDLVRMTPSILATLTLVRGGSPKFNVTPKGRAEKRRLYGPPLILIVVLALSAAASVWYALTSAGLTPLDYEVRGAAQGASVWVIVNSVLVGIAMLRVRAERFGSERRAGVRFQGRWPASLDGVTCFTEDLSLTGAMISVDPDSGSGHGMRGSRLLTLYIQDSAFLFRAVERSRYSDDGRTLVGMEFLGGQQQELARLTSALFSGGVEGGVSAAWTFQGDSARPPADSLEPVHN